MGASIRGEDDRVEPGADDAAVTVYLGGEEVKSKGYRRHRFARRYTREDVALLAVVDEAHGTLSGPATISAMCNTNVWPKSRWRSCIG
jgi:hypothetical protein